MKLTAETLYVNKPLQISEVAERWGCSEAQVRKLIRTGQLGHFRVGSRLIRIPAASVEEYELRQAEAAKAAAAQAAQVQSSDLRRRSAAAAALIRATTRKRPKA